MNLSARVGFHPGELALLRRMPQFWREARLYERAQGDRFPLDRSLIQPMLGDYRAQAGNARGQYFHQDLWAARRIYAARPPLHVDVGSRIDGFVAHVLTFMPVTVVDIRPLQSDVEGLTFRQGDMCRLDGFATGSVPSVSSLHAVEHVGLGRYGDPIDPEGCFTALRELSRIVQAGGTLYIGLPVGRERLIFNSERVFDPRTVVRTLADMRLDAFDAVDDEERFVPNANLETFARAEYSCGLFQFTKA
jgi:hypothetical protein